MSSADAAAFERKVLRRIFGPVRVGDDYRIRINRELYELFNDMDVAKSKIFGLVRVADDYRIRINRELYEVFNDMAVAKSINNQRFR